jgi:Amt family ammonium transporter
VQALAVLATVAFSALGSVAILKLLALSGPLKASAGEEGQGLDFSQHGEEAYTSGDGALLLLPAAAPAPDGALAAREPTGAWK